MVTPDAAADLLADLSSVPRGWTVQLPPSLRVSRPMVPNGVTWLGPGWTVRYCCLIAVAGPTSRMDSSSPVSARSGRRRDKAVRDLTSQRQQGGSGLGGCEVQAVTQAEASDWWPKLDG